MSATADGGTDSSGPANRLGFKAGMVVQELGWDQDTDDQLRIAIEDAIDGDMVDSDYGNVVEAVVLWWRDDDGDLVDGLFDSITDLVGGGVIWLLTPKVGPSERGRPVRHRRGRADRRPGADDDRGGQQRLGRHQADRPQDGRVTGPAGGAGGMLGPTSG